MRKLARLTLIAAFAGGCVPPVSAPAPVPVSVPAATPEPATGLPDSAAPGELVTYPAFGDADPYDWTARRPQSYPIHGIDVSRWQGDIDWHQARSAGVTFAFIKATEGGDLADPAFAGHWQAAKAAGVRRGAYHYFYFCRSAAQQARWFIKHVPRDAASLPHVLDMEWNPRSTTCRLKPDGARVRAEARRFLDMLEAHYGRRPVIYTTVDFHADTGIGRLANTRFWLRSVAGHPRDVYPGAAWTFWQYSGTGIVAGIAGQVDVNVFRGSPEAWLNWAG